MVYATPCAWSFVLRSPDTLRKFVVQAKGAEEYAFAVVHGAEGAAKVEKMGADRAVVSLDRLKMDFTNRVDVAVFAKDAGTQWGAPSFVSFAVVDENAPYADPMLVVRKRPPEPADAGQSASAEVKKPE